MEPIRPAEPVDRPPPALTDLARLARVLWVDVREAAPIVAETVAAVMLQEQGEPQARERAARLLLDRAARRSEPLAPGSAFFRLSPTERFLLGALHHARWSYARVGRVLGLTETQVAELAWGARLQLATAPGLRQRVAFPAASAPGPSCPSHHPGRPWTQRFLDDELAPRERAFLQGHAEGCEGCRQSLSRARELYHAVGARVPRLGDEEVVTWDRELENVRDRSRRMRSREPGFAASLGPFLRRWDIRLLLLGAAALAFRIFSELGAGR